ncbi:MAG: AbrB/MazE/SpoVT family DNA-binding domain-containing protein [Burkholderiaceae bacterium]|mgnify:CR=1 FL=1|jgi:antitoxin MazE
MSAVLSKWGNSLAIRIPSFVAERANIQAGDKLDIKVSRHGRITIAPIDRGVDFGKLYAQITPENRYSEVMASSEQGNEVVVW